MPPQLAVVNGAILKCDKGAAPSPLTVTTNPFVQINGRLVATIGDNMPMVNVFSFGICSITQKPCMPVTPLPWQPGGVGIPTGSPFLVLPKNSLLGCMIGGFIEITDAAQSTVFVAAPPITKTEAWSRNIALLIEQEKHAQRREYADQIKTQMDAENAADEPAGLGEQLLYTAVETGKEVIGDDPVEIGLNFLPWKKLAQLRHLKKLPGALKDTWKAVRGKTGKAKQLPSPTPKSPLAAKKSLPKSPKNFERVTNPPQYPKIPSGYKGELGEKGRGMIYRIPGTTGDANIIKVMPPTEEYPNGYWVKYNEHKQAINPEIGKPGSKGETHIDLPSYLR